MLRPVCCTLAALATVLVLWGTTIPLGIPGEWTWQRAIPSGDFSWSLIPAGMWIVVLGLYVWFGALRFADAKRTSSWMRAAWLVVLSGISFLTSGGLREAAPQEFRSAKAAFVLYFPGSSGYFTEARKVRSTREFLTHYAESLGQGDVLHQGTHPPGLIVGYRGLMWVCQSAWVRRILLETQPQDLRDAFRIISEQSRSTGGLPLSDQDRSVLWLAAITMQLCAAATVIPLYSLLRLHASRTASWQLVSFWPLVPAVTIFLPKSDACFPLFGCAVLASWLHGIRRQSIGLCCAAGLIFWLGMTLSLAMLPVGFLAGLLTLWYFGVGPSGGRAPLTARWLTAGLFAGSCGFLIPTALLWLSTGCNLISVWIYNYQNHAGFYEQFPRTYWAWLLVNPFELSFAAGLPITLLALFGLVRAIRNPRSVGHGPALACLTTWSLLWLSGKNMGEAARLWIFLMPWLVWTSAADWDSTVDENAAVPAWDQPARWMWCWSCQAVAALATVSRVVGFQL